MPYNSLISMLHEIILLQELITSLSHSLDTLRVCKELVNKYRKVYRLNTLTPIAIAILFCYSSNIRVHIRCTDHRHLVFQIREKPRGIVRNRKAMIQKDEPHITSMHQLVILILWQSFKQLHTGRPVLIIPRL